MAILQDVFNLRRQNRFRADLSKLTDSQLDDIGITRADLGGKPPIRWPNRAIESWPASSASR